MQDSGLSVAIGDFLVSFKELPPWVVVMLMVCVTTVVTTFTSNVSTTTIMLPITAQLVRINNQCDCCNNQIRFNQNMTTSYLFNGVVCSELEYALNQSDISTNRGGFRIWF